MFTDQDCPDDSWPDGQEDYFDEDHDHDPDDLDGSGSDHDSHQENRKANSNDDFQLPGVNYKTVRISIDLDNTRTDSSHASMSLEQKKAELKEVAINFKSRAPHSQSYSTIDVMKYFLKDGDWRSPLIRRLRQASHDFDSDKELFAFCQSQKQREL